MAITTFQPGEAVNEKSDAQYQCQFREAAVGQPVLNGAAIVTILATLRDVVTSTVLNSRNAQNVRNANGGTLAGDGTFTLHLTGNVDNIIVSVAPTFAKSDRNEQHRLTLQVTFNKTGGGTGYLNHEVDFFVKSLADVAN